MVACRYGTSLLVFNSIPRNIINNSLYSLVLYLTRSLISLLRKWVEHSKRNSISTRTNASFSTYWMRTKWLSLSYSLDAKSLNFNEFQCVSIAQWLVFKQPCNHRLLTTEKVVDECKAIKLNYKFSRKNYLGLELFDCPKVCLSFWNCSVVSSFSSNWVSTSLGADYCLNDREPFSVFTYSRLNTRGGWKNLRKLCKPDTQSRVCITFKKFSNLPRVFKWDNVNTGKSTLYTISIYHINCGVIQRFPALKKAVTTHVKKCRIF